MLTFCTFGCGAIGTIWICLCSLSFFCQPPVDFDEQEPHFQLGAGLLCPPAEEVFDCWFAWPVLALFALPCSTSPNVAMLTFWTFSCGAMGTIWIWL